MAPRIIVSADDLGLTRGVTDSILEAFDRGALTSASILPNGNAVEYALGECAKRGRLRLAAHLNLTEGEPLSDPKDIPLLLDARGKFKYSPISLYLHYLVRKPSGKARFREEVRRELRAQWDRVRAGAPVASVDGHQHVHMIPCIFDAICELPGMTSVRVPIEPFYYVRGNLKRYVGLHALSRIAFKYLGARNRRHAAAQNIETTDYVLGFLFSGDMRYENVAAGLRAVRARSAQVVELIFHPGRARDDELQGDALAGFEPAWHMAPERDRERELLMSERFEELLLKTDAAPANWLEFWNAEQSVYVSQRHRDANYARIAADLLAIEPHGTGRTLLDYGCGEALATPRFCEAGFRVALFDPAPLMQKKAGRFASQEVTLYTDASLIPAASADIILIVSVLQYLSKDELKSLLPRLRRLLAPGGVLYVADVVPPHASVLADARSLLAAGARNGFFFAALFGLVRTFFSEYRRVRERVGFTTWGEEEIIREFSAAGCAAERLPHNIGFNPYRMTFKVRISL